MALLLPPHAPMASPTGPPARQTLVQALTPPSRPGHCRLRCRAVTGRQLPAIVPRELAAEIEEPAALDMLAALQTTELPLSIGSVQATFVGPAAAGAGRERAGASPVLLLHGFDGSCTEFRRLKPALDPHVDAWAVDLLGNGFCVPSLQGRPDAVLGPEQRREHLHAFWQQQIRRPVTLVGTSLGGAVAVDFALAHPEAVQRLVLLAPQVFTDGIGPMSQLPTFAARLGAKVLQTAWLRGMASKMAYYDKERFATEDATRIGRIHTFVPGWLDATVAFMRSGGYRVSKRIAEVQQQATVVWGAADEVLDPKGGQDFVAQLPHAKLIVLQQCGHSIHLEQPQRTAEIIFEAAGVQPRAGGSAAAVATA